MEERHKNKTIKEPKTMIIGSEKLTPLKYQNKYHGFHLQINKLTLRGLSNSVIFPTYPNGMESYFFISSTTHCPKPTLLFPVAQPSRSQVFFLLSKNELRIPILLCKYKEKGILIGLQKIFVVETWQKISSKSKAVSMYWCQKSGCVTICFFFLSQFS